MYTGKYIKIVGGNGDGQVRIIANNTATVLLVAGAWKPNANDSVYKISMPIYMQVIYWTAKYFPDYILFWLGLIAKVLNRRRK